MGHEASAAAARRLQAPASTSPGVYKPRRPQASPLFRLVSDHVHRLQTVYDERFAREYGPWRPVVGEVTDKFLACGILEHGFARILLGEIARIAARTVTAAIRTLTGERDLAVGIVACLQTHGSRANWHPHLHLLVTDGGIRTSASMPSRPKVSMCVDSSWTRRGLVTEAGVRPGQRTLSE